MAVIFIFFVQQAEVRSLSMSSPSQKEDAMDKAMTALEQALSKDGAAGIPPGEAAALYRKSIGYFEEVLSAVQDPNERDVLSEEINSYKRRADKLEAEQLKASETEQARQRLQAASSSPRALPVPPQAVHNSGGTSAQTTSAESNTDVSQSTAQNQPVKPGRVSAPPAPLAALDRTPAAVAAAAASAAAHRSLPQKSTRTTVAQALQQHLCSIPAARPKSPAAAAASSGDDCLSSASSCCSYGSSDEDRRSACGSGSDSGKQHGTAATAAATGSPTGNSKRSSWGRPQRSAKPAPQRRPQKHTSRLSLGPSSPEAVPTPRKRESNKKGTALTTAGTAGTAAAGVVALEGSTTAPSTPVAAATAAAVSSAGFAVFREGAEEDRVEGEGELCCCGLLRIRYIESMYDICIKPVKVSSIL
jgi:MIT (microtubule interacting and transport) domain